MHIGACRSSIFWTEFLIRYEEGSKLSGIIYLHRISDKRSTTSPSQNLTIVRALCGDAASMNIVPVSNMWNEVSPEVGEERENGLSRGVFKPVLDSGGQMARHHNTVQSAHDIIRRIAENDPVVLQIQRELVDERKDITNTAAGESINQKLNRQIGKHQTGLESIRRDMERAVMWRARETAPELRDKKRGLQERMKEITRDLEGMSSNYAAEKERMEAKVKGVEQGARRESERSAAETKAERKWQLPIRTRRVQDEANASVADRTEPNQETERSPLITIPVYK